MYELFVLGELMDGPLHGYRLHAIIRMAIGPVRQMSWGALYPLIRRLEHDGFIAPEGEASTAPGSRPRKVYRITEAGEQRFFTLMLKADDYDVDFPDLFSIKLVNFDRVTPKQQSGILQHYRGYVQLLCNYLEAGQRFVAAHPEIPRAEKPQILRAMDHRLHVARADFEWIEREIAGLERQIEEGVTESHGVDL